MKVARYHEAPALGCAAHCYLRFLGPPSEVSRPPRTLLIRCLLVLRYERGDEGCSFYRLIYYPPPQSADRTVRTDRLLIPILTTLTVDLHGGAARRHLV